MTEPIADATLAALRARGADTFDPVRFAYLEALARRAAAHDGALRALLDDKLAVALAAYAVQQAAAATAAAAAPRTSPLAALVASLEPQDGANPRELRSVRRFRSTWVRLGVERQLARSLARVPENPGPLNSQRLVQRALRLMQQLSPAYLNCFIAQADAWLWLGRAASAAAAVPARKTGAAATPRRSAADRGRRSPRR